MSLKSKLKARVEAAQAAWDDNDVSGARAALATTGEAGRAIGDVVEAITPDLYQQAGRELMSAFGVDKAIEYGKKVVPEEYHDEIGDVVDSTNLLGLAALKGVPSKYGVTSSAKNYIPYHYGPNIKSNPVMPWETKIPVDLAGQRKARGLMEWVGGTGANMAENMLTPGGRAMIKDTGVPPHVARQLGKPEAKKSFRDKEIDNAQAMYLAHLNKQTRRDGPMSQDVQDLVREQVYQGHRKWEKGDVKKAMKEFDSPDTFLKDADYEYMGNLVENLQPMQGSDLVVKANRGAGGNHYNDLLKDNPATPAIFKAFQKMKKKGGEIDVKRLREALEVEQKAHRKNLGDKKDWFIQEGPEGAVWITGGKVGSAVTEGGVAYVLRVDPKGNMTAVMSDAHDFLEKIPGVNKMVPDGAIAVTPPMHSNIYSIRKQLGESRDVPSARPNRKKTKDSRSQAAMREAIGKTQASPETIQKEMARQGLLTNLMIEEEDR